MRGEEREAPDGRDRPVAVETAADAFSTLGNEVRVEILLALAERREFNRSQAGLTYSDLRGAVGIEDGGRFNYHLDKLRDRFVTKRDDRYYLTYAGMRIVDVVIDGSFDADGDYDREERPVDRSCHRCGSGLSLLTIGPHHFLCCEEHDVVYGMTVPPGATIGRSGEDLLAVSWEYAWQYVRLASADVCPHCWAPIESSVDAAEGRLVCDCPYCHAAFGFPAWEAAVHHPAVVSFFHERGVDVTTATVCFEPPPIDVETTPLDAADGRDGDGVLEVAFAASGDELRAVLTADGTIADLTIAGEQD